MVFVSSPFYLILPDCLIYLNLEFQYSRYAKRMVRYDICLNSKVIEPKSSRYLERKGQQIYRYIMGSQKYKLIFLKSSHRFVGFKRLTRNAMEICNPHRPSAALVFPANNTRSYSRGFWYHMVLSSKGTFAAVAKAKCWPTKDCRRDSTHTLLDLGRKSWNYTFSACRQCVLYCLEELNLGTRIEQQEWRPTWRKPHRQRVKYFAVKR